MTQEEIDGLRTTLSIHEERIRELHEALTRTEIMLEVANERWIAQVNANTGLEVTVRMSQRQQGA